MIYRVGKKLRIKNDHVKCFLAEFVGTMVFISFSFGSVAQYKFGTATDFLSVNISFGFGTSTSE